MPGGVHHKIYSTPSTDGGKAGSGWTQGWATHLGTRKSLCRSGKRNSSGLFWDHKLRQLVVSSTSMWLCCGAPGRCGKTRCQTIPTVLKGSIRPAWTSWGPAPWTRETKMIQRATAFGCAGSFRDGHIGHPNITHRPQGLPKPLDYVTLHYRTCSRHGTIQQRCSGLHEGLGLS